MHVQYTCPTEKVLASEDINIYYAYMLLTGLQICWLWLMGHF